MKTPAITDTKGFAMIAALLALLILTAVGVLVFTVTTRDVRISTRVTGEQKAFSAAEAGLHSLIQTSNLNAGSISSYTATNVQVDAANDPDSRYTIGNSTITGVPASLPISGFEVGGSTGKAWGQSISNKNVTGTNTRYNSSVSVDVGIGYGPVEISTGQPAAGG